MLHPTPCKECAPCIQGVGVFSTHGKERKEVNPIPRNTFNTTNAVDPSRVGSILMSLLNAIQDAQGSREDKVSAIACLFRETVVLCKERNTSLRSAATSFLEFAENLSTEQITGLPKPEFQACHAFVENELALKSL